MSEPAPKPGPNAKRDLITRFREEYAVAIADAVVSAEHTATEGWQRLYTEERERQIERRRMLAQSLRNIADRAEVRGLSEEEEKEISECKKASADIRDRHFLFELETIEPVKRAANKCEQIIEEAKGQAHRDERDAPLVNVGLIEIMKMEIAKVQRVRWNDDTGQVFIVDAVLPS